MRFSKPRTRLIGLVLIGVAAGLLSGAFGIGGGTIIVPALTLWFGMSQRLAAGTSVAAILPTAALGAVSYAVQGYVDWVAAICLAVGMIIGAQIGSRLLAKLRGGVLQWGFMGFLAVVIVSLWFVVPARSDRIEITMLAGALLIFTGLATGVLSGVLGVGGGAVVVPVLMFFFGASDLIAKGSSLLMMVPGSVSATLGNFRRQNVDLRAAAIVGVSACACVPFGSLLAVMVDPFWGNVAFSCYLAIVLVQMLWRNLRRRRGSTK